MRISDWSSDVCSSDLSEWGLPCRSRPYRENWRRLRKEHLASPLHSRTLFEKTGLAASSIDRRACPAVHADIRALDAIGQRTGEPGDPRRDNVHATQPAEARKSAGWGERVAV